MYERISARFRIFLISFLVLISLASIGYFHLILHFGTVYTHFFYFPIILASLWWGRRGIPVSVLLSAALMAAHVYTRRYDASPDDLIRAGTFVLISVVVAILSERAAMARERMRHFNLVLRSIRDINHLIIKEKDQDRLIRGICEKLVRNRSYHFAWIALMDDHGRLVASAGAGLGEMFQPMVDMLAKGSLPLCAQRTSHRRGAFITRDPRIECAGCPLAVRFPDQGRMTVGLYPGGRLRGMLNVSMPEKLITDREEHILFEEIAADVEYALGGLALRDEHEVTLEEMKESEERFRLIVENAPFGYYRIDRGGVIEYVNPEWERMLGFSGREMRGRHITVTQPGDVRRRIIDETERVMAGETVRGGFGLKRKDGSIAYLNYYSQPLYRRGEIVGAEGFLSDITEIKNAELALTRSRLMLSRIIDGSPIPAFVIDGDHTVTHWNRACEKLTGYSAAVMVGTRRQWEPFYPEKRPTMADIVIHSARDPEAAKRYEGEMTPSAVIREAGQCERFFPLLGMEGRWLFFTAALLRDAEGRIAGAIETLQDITERKKAEEEKLRAHMELEQIFNTTPVGMRVVDRDYRTIHINRRFMEMFDLDSSHFSKGGSVDWDRELVKTDRALMKRIPLGERYMEYEMRARVRGREIVCMVHASPYFSRDGSVVGVIESFTDITETRTLQDGIMHIAETERQRIGQDLHDGLGQNLTAVTFLIEAMKEKTAHHAGAGVPDIEQIEGLVRNAIVQTRSLSRMLSPVEMERNGLRAALEEMAETTEKIYGVSCRVFQEGNFFVEDNQAATHLFYIAREAVTNSIKHGKAGRIAIRLVEEAGACSLTVRDDGSGAPEGPADTGLGLRIMRYRAGLIGADFSAGNIEEGGFEVSVRIRPESGDENGAGTAAG